MVKKITLSETAVKLLSEFRDADVKFEWAKKSFADMESHDPEYDKKVDMFNMRTDQRNTAACVFAASMAAEVYKEVTHV